MLCIRIAHTHTHHIMPLNTLTHDWDIVQRHRKELDNTSSLIMRCVTFQYIYECVCVWLQFRTNHKVIFRFVQNLHPEMTSQSRQFYKYTKKKNVHSLLLLNVCVCGVASTVDRTEQQQSPLYIDICCASAFAVSVIAARLYSECCVLGVQKESEW